MTAVSICFLYPLISTFSSANHVTSPFFVLSILKNLNDLSIGSILIFSSLTSCLLIPVWVHPESTNACSHSSFLFFVLMLVYTFSSLALLFLWFGIIYQFWELLCIKVHYIMPTPNLWQNPSFCHPLLCLICLTLLGFSWSSSSIWTCNLLLSVLLCHTCSISSSFSFLDFLHSFAIYSYMLQLKHLSLPFSSKLS